MNNKRNIYVVSELAAKALSSISLGKLSLWVFSRLPNNYKSTFKIRKALDNFQPTDPMRGFQSQLLPSVDVLLPASQKDFAHVARAIHSIQEFSRNPIEDVKVVVPARDLAFAKSFGWPAQIESEEKFLPAEFLMAAHQLDGTGLRGWALQVLIKIYGPWNSRLRSTVVFDSDTSLLSPITWVNPNGTQSLSFSYEYHRPYETRAEEIWGVRRRDEQLSYVTHFMLFQPEVLREMFPTRESILEALINSPNRSKSSFSEYHSYGRWIRDHYPHRTKIARWRNIPHVCEFDQLTTPEKQLEALKNLLAGFSSTSSHSYLDS